MIVVAVIAKWNRQRLPFCSPGFESQAQHLFFSIYIPTCHLNVTERKKLKEAEIGPFLTNQKNLIKLSDGLKFFDEPIKLRIVSKA